MVLPHGIAQAQVFRTFPVHKLSPRPYDQHLADLFFEGELLEGFVGPGRAFAIQMYGRGPLIFLLGLGEHRERGQRSPRPSAKTTTTKVTMVRQAHTRPAPRRFHSRALGMRRA